MTDHQPNLNTKNDSTSAEFKAKKREIVRRFAQADDRIGALQVFNTLIPLAGAWWLVSLTPQHSIIWPVLATIAMTLLLVRVFVLMHECGHGSLFASQRLNKFFGFIFGVISGMPQYVWTQHHNFHHATNGNWARYRGPLAVKTREEFNALSDAQQQNYVRERRVRMAPLAGLLYMIVNPRINWLRGVFSLARHVINGKRQQPASTVRELADQFETPHWADSAEFRHMTLNNVVLLSSWVVMSLWLGPMLFFTVYLITGALAGGIGIVLFTVQHNFEHAYASGEENWDYDDAALNGTSFLDLPAWLNWCTASIGYHHVHHMSARIPNYRLAQCHRENQELFREVRRLHVQDVIPAMRFILWDQQSRRIISVAEHISTPLDLTAA